MLVFRILYIDEILLISDNVKVFSDVRGYLNRILI